MKLDVNALRHLSRDDFRTLTAVEQGQKNVGFVCFCVAREAGVVCRPFLAFSTLERRGRRQARRASGPNCLPRPPRPICSLATR